MANRHDPFAEIAKSPLDDDSGAGLRRRRLFAVAVAVVLVGATSIYVTVRAIGRDDGSSAALTTVTTAPTFAPDLRGLDTTEADATARASGLTIRATSTDGIVVAQDPGPGQPVTEGAIIAVQTANARDIGCSNESADASPLIDVPGTFGGVTILGYRTGQTITLDDSQGADARGAPAHFLQIQLDAGAGPVWFYMAAVNGRTEAPLAAGLRFDGLDQTHYPPRYLPTDSARLVELQRCHTDSPTRYLGAIVFEVPACVSLWLFEESLATDPSILNFGIGTPC